MLTFIWEKNKVARNEKNYLPICLVVFVFQKYGTFWSISLGHFMISSSINLLFQKSVLYLIILRIKTLLDVYFFHHQTYQILRCSSPGRSKKEVALGLSFVFSRRVKCNYDYIVIVTSWSPRPPFSSCFATGYRLGVAVYYRLWQSHYVFALFQWENITSKQKSTAATLLLLPLSNSQHQCCCP